MRGVERVRTWHRTRVGHVAFALGELALAYAFASLAVNSGSLWQWALALVSAAGFLRNLLLSVLPSRGRA